MAVLVKFVCSWRPLVFQEGSCEFSVFLVPLIQLPRPALLMSSSGRKVLDDACLLVTCSYSKVYRELEQAIRMADAQEDLRWFRNTSGPGMPMNWPQVEVRSGPIVLPPRIVAGSGCNLQHGTGMPSRWDLRGEDWCRATPRSEGHFFLCRSGTQMQRKR